MRGIPAEREAQAAVGAAANSFDDRLAAMEKRADASTWRNLDSSAEQQKRLDAMTRAEKLVSAAAE